jgi:hypothetical protein
MPFSCFILPFFQGLFFALFRFLQFFRFFASFLRFFIVGVSRARFRLSRARQDQGRGSGHSSSAAALLLIYALPVLGLVGLQCPAASVWQLLQD